MIHVLIDAYGCATSRLDNLRDVYEVIYNVINTLNVKAIMPPQLIPYYYSNDMDDVGISAFVLTEGGHFTIHTFPQWQCYFADLLYDGYANAEDLKAVLDREFPCGRMFFKRIDRDEDDGKDVGIYQSSDFGPHYMIRTTLNHEPTIDEYMNMLDRMPYKVDMHPITRPYVLKSSVDNPRYLSGIIVIAESHIAVHYNYETRRVLMDIFSCKKIDDAKYQELMATLFDAPYVDVLIRRGRANEQRKISQKNKHESHNRWQDNIRPKK